MNKITVALIEDNNEDADAVKSILNKSARTLYKLHRYTSLGEAISGISSENKPDVILVDLTLPDTPDREMAIRLVSTIYSSSVVIAYTSTDEIGIATAATLLGADDFIVKNPSSLEHLDLTINICVARKSVEASKIIMSQQGDQIAHFLSHFAAGMPKLIKRCSACLDVWHAPSRKWMPIFDFLQAITDIRFTDGYCTKPECKMSIAKAVHELSKKEKK